MATSTRLPRAARRVQLLDAAARAFLDRGFDGTSMEDVAHEAGVSRLIVYRIFDSKHDLYRSVLAQVTSALAHQFVGVALDEIRTRGAARMMLPVARAHPDAFRLLWRHAWHEPDFADEARELRTHVTFYAGEMLRPYLGDQLMLDWAARSAGAHLVEGICNWLDAGDPSRDDEFATTLTVGLRALATAWADRSI
jgi:AcrR family transcriptional regulator